MTARVSLVQLCLGLLTAGPVALAQEHAPEIFGAGVISTGLDELNAAFTPDGRELYYAINAPENAMGVIVVSRREGDEWSSPEVASFSGRYSDYDPFFSPDGSRLFFISNRPVADEDKSPQDYDIWVVERSGSGWGEPRNLGAPINTERPEYYAAVTTDGTLYFSARRDDTRGSYDVYRSRYVNGSYQEPENLGDAINGRSAEIDVYVSPDESYLVFAAYGRRDSHGGGDLYISYLRDGSWTTAVNLGLGINSSAREYTPIASPDGRWFYWTSKRGFADEGRVSRRLTMAELHRTLTSHGNGEGDIYRIPIEGLHAAAAAADSSSSP